MLKALQDAVVLIPQVDKVDLISGRMAHKRLTENLGRLVRSGP